MALTSLSEKSTKELEALLANTLPGSNNHELIKPVLEAKRRRADARRTWIIALVSGSIAVLGIVVGWLSRR